MSQQTARPTFTRDDVAQSQAYMKNRTLLFQLWELAETYPSVASKIHVRVRMADPRRDYHYDEHFADSAIVVNLSWLDPARTCEYLSCTSVYPRGRTCRAGDEPRVFPSGDNTTLVACEPSCFLITDSRTSTGDPLSDVSSKFRSDACSVMSVRTGEFTRRGGDSIGRKESAKGATTVTTVPKNPVPVTPDFPQLEYSPELDSCEESNTALLTFITQPHERSNEHNVCRQDNFLLGDDLVRATLKLADGETRTIVTGRHSKSYCAAFDKEFDAAERTCHETWFDRVMSHTFVGSALVRLARNVMRGGDGCDTLFPADADRRETSELDVPETKRSRRRWFEDVDRTWCLPPPNVLLSDLGITELGQVWSNRDGGRLEVATWRDYAASTTNAFTDERSYARAALQRSAIRRQNDALGDKKPIVGLSINDEETRKRDKKDGDGEDNDEDRKSHGIMNFDAIYDELNDTRQTMSETIRELEKQVTTGVGEIAGVIITEVMAVRIMKLAYNRTLRFMGQHVVGHTRRHLLRLGINVGASNLIANVFTRYTTRLLLALGTTATVVGSFLTIVELLGFVLDLMLVFGWDPGQYRSEFDNAVYDDFATAWVMRNKRLGVTPVNPYLVLTMFDRSLPSDGGDGRDDSTSARAKPDARFRVDSSDRAPWYFARFSAAVDALVRDHTSSSDDREPDIARTRRVNLSENSRSKRSAETSIRDDKDTHANPLDRLRPIVSENSLMCSVMWSMQYFSHRRTNSLGQRVDDHGDDHVRVDDRLVAESVRDNELAALLSSALSSSKSGASRATLLGAARRNVASKILGPLSAGTAVACGALALCLTAGGALIAKRIDTRIAVALSIAIVLALMPLVLVISAYEYVAPDAFARSYDRDVANGDGSLASTIAAVVDTDAVDELCDSVTSIFAEDSKLFSSVLLRPLRNALIDKFRPELRVVYGV